MNIHVLTADRISVTVAPELGGRLVELTDTDAGRQWLWRNHENPLGRVASGAEYDDVWQGGFEELFPSDAPISIGGVDYPDHGELWSIPWDLEEISDSSIAMSTVGPASGVEVTKIFSLSEARLDVRYELAHRGRHELPILFKLHPAFDIDENCRIDVPGGVVEEVESGFGNLLEGLVPEPWPTSANLSECRPRSSGTNEFVYVSDMPEGHCGVVDEQARSWVRLDYSQDQFPYCWIFMSYGGWRGRNVVVLEPCTNYPKDLAAAIESGTSARLLPGETVQYEAAITVGDLP